MRVVMTMMVPMRLTTLKMVLTLMSLKMGLS